MRNFEVAGIRWHSGFYSAAELEFGQNQNDLEFQREYNLSKEPLRMDLLVIKKRPNVYIWNELGHLFKKYNVVEYKSPNDSLTIDDYYKTISYACLYKGLGEKTDQIPAEEVTVSIFRESYPRELFKKLNSMGNVVKEYCSGIYYITGYKVLFDTQIIVTRQLNKKTHHSLRVLSNKVEENDAKGFIKEAMQLLKPGDRNNVDAVLQVSVSANRELYDCIRRHDKIMCDALKELMKEDFDKIRAEYEEREQETILTTIKNLMDSTRWTAEQAMAAMKIPDADRGKYMAKLQ